MADNDNVKMTAQQQAEYRARLEQAAARLGLDPQNMDHLEATEATLIQMQRLQVESGDTQSIAQQKEQQKLEIATEFGIDTVAYKQQQEQNKQEGMAAQKAIKTRGIINMVITGALAIAAAVFTYRHADKNIWKGWQKWLGSIGAFLAAGAGTAQLGYLTLAKPVEKKLDDVIVKIGNTENQFEEKLATSMALYFVKQIEQEHAEAAAKAQQAPQQQVTSQPAPQPQPQVQQPEIAPTVQVIQQGPSAAPQPVQKTQEQVLAEAKRNEAIKAEVDAGREATYPSGTDSLVEAAGNRAPMKPIDRVAPPSESFVVDAAAEKEKAATKQHAVV